MLRLLGESSTSKPDPARTLRSYAGSVLEGHDETTLVGKRTPSPLPHPSPEPATPIGLDERRLLARKKLRLQRDLLQAAQGGDYLDVSILLGEGVEVDWMEEAQGMTALHLAAQHGHLKIAEMLLEAGADIEARSDAFGNEWIVRTEKGRTPLIWAATGRGNPRMQERMCRLLLEKGADVNARSVSYRTALQEAAMSVRNPGVDPRSTFELLIKNGAYVNAFDAKGWTALTECGLWGQKELGELLLAHGAHVDAEPSPNDPAARSNPCLTTDEHIPSPLVKCGEWSWNEELISLLLEKGASPHTLDEKENTLRQLAEKANRENVIRMLSSIGLYAKHPQGVTKEEEEGLPRSLSGRSSSFADLEFPLHAASDADLSLPTSVIAPPRRPSW